jgi:hypothetical protein
VLKLNVVIEFGAFFVCDLATLLTFEQVAHLSAGRFGRLKVCDAARITARCDEFDDFLVGSGHVAILGFCTLSVVFPGLPFDAFGDDPIMVRFAWGVTHHLGDLENFAFKEHRPRRNL